MSDKERGFKGIWIPAEVWEDERLSACDKMVFAGIYHLAGSDPCCFADTTTLSCLCGCSEYTVRKSISNLKKFGYINETRCGRSRLVAVLM